MSHFIRFKEIVNSEKVPLKIDNKCEFVRHGNMLLGTKNRNVAGNFPGQQTLRYLK